VSGIENAVNEHVEETVAEVRAWAPALSREGLEAEYIKAVAAYERLAWLAGEFLDDYEATTDEIDAELSALQERKRWRASILASWREEETRAHGEFGEGPPAFGG
jgi:hypothetical protein